MGVVDARNTRRAVALCVALCGAGCASPPPAPEIKTIDWTPSRVAPSPANSVLASPRPEPLRAAPGKFPLRFYENLQAHPVVAPLAAVDIWDLGEHPRRYDIITIGAVPITDYSGRGELLDQLAVTHGVTRDKAAVLTGWVKSGGVLWIEFGVFVQGHEWIRRTPAAPAASPDLAHFTIFGFPTRPVVFEGRRVGAFAIEPSVVRIRNEASHVATADIKRLTIVQSELRTSYPIIDALRAEPLVRQGALVYATVVSLGDGKIISTVPFDSSDVDSDGEKYRINLVEWLGGFPIPVADHADTGVAPAAR